MIKKYDTLRNYNSLLIGTTVVVQREDGALCTHGTIVENGDQNIQILYCRIVKEQSDILLK